MNLALEYEDLIQKTPTVTSIAKHLAAHPCYSQSNNQINLKDTDTCPNDKCLIPKLNGAMGDLQKNIYNILKYYVLNCTWHQNKMI